MLNGKIALVTGGSRGIGRAIALKLAQYGADVAVIYHGNAELAQGVVNGIIFLGRRALALPCDVADFERAKAAVDAVNAQLGAVDILVNNAGVPRDGLLAVMKEEAWDTVLDTNLKGAFNMTRHCLPRMIKKRAGRVINISSAAGIIGNAGQTNYSASKAGLIGFTKATAREVASRGICVNAIAPGFVRSDMTENIAADNPLMASIPLGRPGEAEEIAALAAFLADDTGAYITGETIRIDGGLAI
jgi:3-oxoacyl-[acyl-carrier protein] reductase